MKVNKQLPGIAWQPADWWKPEGTCSVEKDRLSHGRFHERRLILALEKPSARAGERWNEIMVSACPVDCEKSREKSPANQAELRVRLFAIGGSKSLEEITFAPEHSNLMLLADLRRHALSKARLSVDLFEDKELVESEEVFLEAEAPVTMIDEATSIPVNFDFPAGVQGSAAAGNTASADDGAFPVTFGVPFPAGALWEVESLALFDASGAAVPHQKEVTGLWGPNGSIKWIRFDALVSSAERLFVRIGAGHALPDSNRVNVTHKDGVIVMDTGPARYILEAEHSPIREIWMGGRIAAASEGSAGLYVVDQNGRTASAAAKDAEIEIESSGPLAACVRIEGFYAVDSEETFARHITRIEGFAGQAAVKVTHTLVIIHDTKRLWFKEVGWQLNVMPGEDPKALFGTSRENPEQCTIVKLDKPDASAFIFQETHFRFSRGENHFAVGSNGGAATVADGEEMGDWALLHGEQAGLLSVCKESARQHPKEFELSKDKLNLRLFSNRGGEELDFRAEVLADKWNLDLWLSEEDRESVKRNESNATGWSKTHELCFCPLAPNGIRESAVQIAILHSKTVYAAADPEWIWKTEVLGPLHPKNTKQFPDVEQYIEGVFEYWNARGHEPGFYGFMDYYSGPVCWGGEWHLGVFWGTRYRYSYTLRADLWRLYARSGERRIRDFAEGANRAYLDNYVAHCDGPRKTKGLYVIGEGDESGPPTTPHHLPFYWESCTTYDLSGTTDLSMFMLDYHLTGYRRGRDAVVAFGDGMKRAWDSERIRTDPRGLMAMRVLTQAYEATWDPALRELTEETANLFYDPDGELLLIQDRPHRINTWKTETDIAALIEAWVVFGTKRFYAMARRVSEFWWNHLIGSQPTNTHLGYTNPMGQIGNFLYRETGDESIPAGLDFHIRWATSGFNPETGEFPYYLGKQTGDVIFLFRGVPFAQDIFATAGRENGGGASWIAFDDEDTPGSATAIVLKKAGTKLDVTATTPGGGGYGELTDRIYLKRVQQPQILGADLTHFSAGSEVAHRIRIPKDSPEGAFRIGFGTRGVHFVSTVPGAPLVIHAPDGFMPLELRPQVKIYFEVPENAESPEISIEGSAQLFMPDEKSYSNGETFTGTVSLPAEACGLWHLVAVQSGLICVKNLPPFFAFGNASNYFKPDLSEA